jgi:hypothetical protein
MSRSAHALAPIRAVRRRSDGGFTVDADGFDGELARWARRIGQLGWSTTIEGLSDLPAIPIIVVVSRTLIGAEPLVVAAALADERVEGVRCAELIDAPVVESWQRRIGFIRPTAPEITSAVRRGTSVVVDAQHMSSAMSTAMAEHLSIVPAAVMTSSLRRHRSIRLGNAQYTSASGPLAAARLRDAIVAELERTVLAARATWRMA